MAWHARLQQITSTAEKVQATFGFYDDTAAIDPKTGQPTIYYAETFAFDPTWTAGQMQAAVVARGTQVRAATTRAQALAAQFPTGTTVIDIP